MPSSYGLLLYLNVLPIKLVLAENYSMQQESELEIESFYDILPSPMATQKCFLNAYLERVITIRKKPLQLCFTLVQAEWCLQHTVRLLMWPSLTAMKKHYRWGSPRQARMGSRFWIWKPSVWFLNTSFLVCRLLSGYGLTGFLSWHALGAHVGRDGIDKDI